MRAVQDLPPKRHPLFALVDMMKGSAAPHGSSVLSDNFIEPAKSWLHLCYAHLSIDI